MRFLAMTMGNHPVAVVQVFLHEIQALILVHQLLLQNRRYILMEDIFCSFFVEDSFSDTIKVRAYEMSFVKI